MNTSAVAAETVNWDYSHGGRVQSIAVDCFSNAPLVEGAESALPVLLLGGYGENRAITSRAIAHLGEQGIHAVGAIMPFNAVPADRAAVIAVATEAPHAVADHYKGQQGQPEDAPIAVIGHSQGGGVWALARQARPEGLGDAALWAPLAFDRLATDTTPEGRRTALFVTRFLLNGFKQNPFDPNVLLGGAEVTRQVLFDLRTGRFGPKVGQAMMLSMQRQAIEHIAAGHRVGIPIGLSDRVFRAAKIQAALQANRCPGGVLPTIIEVPGSHATMNSRVGRRQLGAAAEFLGRVPVVA